MPFRCVDELIESTFMASVASVQLIEGLVAKSASIQVVLDIQIIVHLVLVNNLVIKIFTRLVLNKTGRLLNVFCLIVQVD